MISLGGTELRGEAGHSPQHKLSALMLDAKAGDPVTVEYRRDGKLQKTQVVPKSLPAFLFDSVGHNFEGLGDVFVGLNPIRHDLSGFGSTKLLDLSPTLGRYFG